MTAVSREAVRAPFSYFGGKGKVAPVVWRAFGADVSSYVEPFAGSLAVLLGRPGGPGKLETVNDRDCMVSNFWRSVQHDPYEVAAHCDWPVSEPDLHARHQWLVEHLVEGAEFREKMLSDPDHHDPKIAGWWVWGIAQWIGGGWCREPGQGASRGRPRPHLGSPCGVHVDVAKGRRPNLHNSPALARQTAGRMPNLGNTRRGVHRDHLPAGHSEIANALLAEMAEGRAPPCFEWFVALLDRLRRVRIVCGDWKRVLTPSVLGTTTTRNSGMVPCAVFLDPPYGDEFRDPYLYSVDDGAIAAQVAAWALEHGDDPGLRIAVCGFEGEHEFPPGWTVHAWKGVKGYGSGKNRDKERIWFSKGCNSLDEKERQQSLFRRTA